MSAILRPPPFTVRKPQVRNLKLLIYGGYGAGKTHFIGSALEDAETFGRVLLLAADPGDLTLAGKDIDVVDVKDFESDMSKVYEYLAGGDHPYGTVAIDGLTDLSDLSLTGIMARAVEMDSDKDPDQPDIGQWGKLSSQMRKIIRAYRDLPMTVIMTALDKEVKDEKSGKLYIRPALSGQLANTAGAFFDIVGYMATSEERAGDERIIHRILRVQPSERVAAKDRTRKLGVELIDPTLGSMMKLINDPERDLTPAPGVEPKVNLKKVDIKTKK